jgi:hypothetical protein
MTFWIVISFAGIACLLLTWFVPRLQVKDLAANAANEKFLAENEARKTIAQIIGGLAILIGLYSTNATLKVANQQASLTQGQLDVAQDQFKLAQEQFGLAQSGQVTDRFNKATEQLGKDSSIAERLGALLAFKRLAVDSKPDSWRVMTLIAAWIQAKAPRSPMAPPTRSKLPTDIQQALYVLNSRDVSQDHPGDDFLDLSGTDLRGAYLYNANLASMWLDDINFDGANLTNADLHDSSVMGASFKGAHVEGANLRVWEESASPAQLTAIFAGSIGDTTTKLPDDVPVPGSWKK